MTGDEAVQRLRAFQKGRPLPCGETLRVPRIEPARQLVLAFVRMGGESSPWGLAYGRPDKPPTVLAVAEPRTRDDVAQMMARFAPVLLTHLNHPHHSPFGPDPEAKVPLPQVWLPNDAHLEMLHHLAYAYTFNRAEDMSRRRKLRALGHACGWLFREAQRPGQMVVMVASRVLREAYTFPAETTRQGHLGFLLAWLESSGGRDARMAAAEAAEALPVSTNLDPEFERMELLPYVEMYGDGRRDGNDARMARGRRVIERRIDEEVRRRYDLVVRAIQVLGRDKRQENRHLSVLIDESMKEHTLQYRRIEARQVDRFDSEDGPAFIPSPETDRYPAAAGSRYYVQQASEELRDLLLVHDDREMQAQVVAAGEGIAGTIVDVWDEGEGRSKKPIWVVESDMDVPSRLREDSELCVVGLRDRKVRIRSIEKRESGGRRFELQVTGLVTVPRSGDRSVLPASSPLLKGRKVVLVKPSMDQIARRKSGMIWNADVPGGWLTHRVPKVVAADLPEEVGEDLDVLERGAR